MLSFTSKRFMCVNSRSSQAKNITRSILRNPSEVMRNPKNITCPKDPNYVILGNTRLQKTDKGGIMERLHQNLHNGKVDTDEIWAIYNLGLHINDYSTFQKLIRSFSHNGLTSHAFQIYRDMKKAGIKPTYDIYTTLLFSCRVSDQNHIEDIKYIYEQVIQNQFDHKIDFFYLTIKASISSKDYDFARQVFDKIPSLGLVPNVPCLTAMMEMYKDDSVNLVSLWQSIKVKDLILYSVYLKLIKELKLYSQIESLFHEFEKSGLKPDLIFTTLLVQSANSTSDDAFILRVLQKFLGEWGQYVPSDRVLYHSTILSCVYANEDVLKALIELMRRNNFKFTHATYGDLIVSSARIGAIDTLRKVFEEARVANMLSSKCYFGLLVYLKNVGNAPAAWNVYLSSKASNTKLDSKTMDVLNSIMEQSDNKELKEKYYADKGVSTYLLNNVEDNTFHALKHAKAKVAATMTQKKRKKQKVKDDKDENIKSLIEKEMEALRIYK